MNKVAKSARLRGGEKRLVEVRKIAGSKMYAIYENGMMIPGSKGDKKKVTRKAAELAGVDYKTFLRMQKED